MNKTIIAFLGLIFILTGCHQQKKQGEDTAQDQVSVRDRHTRWTEEEAWKWHEQWGWLRGANFQPSTAINQLEMWQEETFDPETIDRELGWAEAIGFNAMRVYLHHLAWEENPSGFKQNLKEYLAIADNHGIATIFVFFDDCWNATYEAGEQPEPKPGIHNSGWVQDPGDIDVADSLLEAYVKDILTEFGSDKRIALWDLYNEPGNSGHGNESMPLLKKVFEWGREVNPGQPLSVGVWNYQLSDLNKIQLENSDIITYHNYGDEVDHQGWIDSLKIYKRPLVCTEYMARTRNSNFQNIMPLLKRENVGAINWGFVSGRTNTIYAWDTPLPDGREPEVWFHDILRKDGTPYRQEEVDLIKSLTNK